jgi:phosphoadenosine phosphosulfate reductase
MSVAEIAAEVNIKLDAVRTTLAREVTGKGDVCLTCSFQAEDVLLTKLAIALDPQIPILFLDTGYHFAEMYAYRDRVAQEWDLNLINLLPEKTVAEQETEHGLLYQTAPDRCCGLRKVEPLFKAVAGYRVWLTGLRREQARSRAALEESAMFSLPGGKQVLKLAPLVEWTTRDVWYASIFRQHRRSEARAGRLRDRGCRTSSDSSSHCSSHSQEWAPALSLCLSWCFFSECLLQSRWESD